MYLFLDYLTLLLPSSIHKIYTSSEGTKYEDNCYISFSGGKDSTVLLHLARQIYPNIPAVYIDTGLEFPEVREFALSQTNVIKLVPKMNFKQVIETYGYPVVSKEQAAFIQEYRDTKSKKLKDIRWNGNKYGRGKISKKYRYLIDAPFKISDKCCDIMKKNPAQVFEKESGLHPIIGTMACESAQRKSNWLMYGCNAFDAKRPTSKPLSFWTEQDILEYIVKYNISYSDAYGDIIKDENGLWKTTGESRTGCMFCMFGLQYEDEPNKFQRMNITHKYIHDWCCKDCDFGGLGLQKVCDYMNVKTE